MSETSYPHRPVLLEEVTELFRHHHLKTFVDGTLGAGGHAEALLKSHPEIEHYIGIDQDRHALDIAAKRLSLWKEKVRFEHGNFVHFNRFLKEQNLSQVDGILIDLGVSSMQLDQAERGFSFSKEGPLDMRMDRTKGVTAADVVNTYSEGELGNIFRDYGEEKRWRIAARAIVQARRHKDIHTTTELINILRPVLSWNPRKGINPLTLIFQALRIHVNQELEVLEAFIPEAIKALAPAGRLAVISFHSLEDRIAKQRMRFEADDKWDTIGIGGVFLDKKPSVSLVTRKPIVPAKKEIKDNPRSSSAKLRCVEKLPDPIEVLNTL